MSAREFLGWAVGTMVFAAVFVLIGIGQSSLGGEDR